MSSTKKGPSRLARTIRSLLVMIAIGAGLAGYNAFNQRRDVAMATGPTGQAQDEFFAAAADRPDIALFFKGLTPQQRLVMSKRIGEYDDARLANLIGKLLGTFDADARVALTDSLVRIGRKHPQAVADQLNVAGSLQQFAISTALRAIGPSALPAVAAKLKADDARNNAEAYLVSSGPAAVPPLIPVLDDSNKDVRLAAADALGKLGVRDAVPKLTELYQKSEGDERFGYLSALAGIGAPESEELLTREASDESVAGPRRATAMLGLGRIGSPTAIATLWKLESAGDDPQLRDAVVSGLQLAGEGALSSAPSPAEGLRVAAGVRTPAADNYIVNALGNPELREQAAEAASNRPEIVPQIAAAALAARDGLVADALLRALSTTSEGIARLKTLSADPNLCGFALRRLRLVGVNG